MTAGEHRTTRQHDRRQVGGCGTHHHRRCRLVATGEQHDTVDRVAPDRLLDIHRHQVAQQHRRRLDLRLAERGDRELQRHPARLPDPSLDVLGQLAEVLVARREIGRRVADPDHRLARERVVGQPALHPAPVDVVVAGAALVPAGGPQPDRRPLDRHQWNLPLEAAAEERARRVLIPPLWMRKDAGHRIDASRLLVAPLGGPATRTGTLAGPGRLRRAVRESFIRDTSAPSPRARRRRRDRRGVNPTTRRWARCSSNASEVGTRAVSRRSADVRRV